MSLVLALILSVVGFAYDVRSCLRKPEEPPLEFEGNDSESVGADAGGTGADDAGMDSTKDDEESFFLPAGPIYSVKTLFADYFYLSQVKDSEMLTLFSVISPDGAVTAAALQNGGQQLSLFLERCAHPLQFFPFYEGIEHMFPEGETDFTFDKTVNYEQSMAQIRGAAKTLKRHWEGSRSDKFYEDCHHLAIRAKDAIYFGAESGEAQPKMIWVLGEIAFAALINEVTYGGLSGSALSDWYYRMAQVFDYFGGIADTNGLKLKMYFVSAVCYYRAYEEIRGRGFLLAGGSYGSDIWAEYFEMLYRVALRADGSQERADFFAVIWDGEQEILSSGLPEQVIKETEEELNKYQIYQEWKAVYGKSE